MSGYAIEPMSAGDWPAVCRIYEEGIATGIATFERGAPDWPTWDGDHMTACRFVARDAGGGVLGWVALTPYSSRCVYEGVADLSVYVAASARGRGVGTALMHALVEAAEAEGIWTLQAGVIAQNEASLALHERCGFRRVGVREKIGRNIAGDWNDVVLLERRSERVGRD